MSELTTIHAPVTDAPPSTAVYTVTQSELEMLNELASATRDTEVRGTSVGVAAVNTLLVYELAGHARQMAAHLARLASTVTSGQNPGPIVPPAPLGAVASAAATAGTGLAARNPAAFSTNSALDASSIAGIATRLTEVVHTTIQPQISALQDTAKHQSGQIDAIATRFTEVVHTTIQPQITALQDTVKQQSGLIVALQTAMKPVEPEIEAAAAELGHVENHLRRLQEHHDALSFSVRDLADKLPLLIEADRKSVV